MSTPLEDPTSKFAKPGRKALITGGDSGMGRAAAIAFAREGADADPRRSVSQRSQ